MRTTARLLILFFALTTATSVFYAVQQQRALDAARLANESLDRERTELREQLRSAELRRNEIVRANRPGPEAVTAAATATETVATGDAAPILNEVTSGGRLPPLMDNPEAQRLMAVQQKGALDARYGALFRQLNLPPDQLARLKDLLVEKRTAAVDVLAAARSQGMNQRENRAELRQLVQETQGEIDDSIRALLGDSGFARYQNFEQTQPQRAVATRLEQRLSYSGIPLSPQQSEQLVQALASASGAQSTAGSPPFGMPGSVPLTDEMLASAAAVLNPTQLQALRQLQEEQQAQAQLNQLMREQAQSRRQNRAATPPSATPPRG